MDNSNPQTDDQGPPAEQALQVTPAVAAEVEQANSDSAPQTADPQAPQTAEPAPEQASSEPPVEQPAPKPIVAAQSPVNTLHNTDVRGAPSVPDSTIPNGGTRRERTEFTSVTWKSSLEKIKKEIESGPWIRMNIHLETGEKRGAFETVNINGVRYEIKKGVSVDLPGPVADMLANYLNIQLGSGNIDVENEFSVDKSTESQDALT